ncbi:MAG: hypothetical protein GXP49_11155 [Deltaproteobacteria bacterium]|nr:hypothetical protein [Deltaproteobacteria bacterium]
MVRFNSYSNIKVLALSLVLSVFLFNTGVFAGKKEREKIAVMELAAKSGIKQAQLDVLGDMLATELRNIGKYEVITKDDIKAMLGLEKAKEFLGCDDASCMADVGGALGVDKVISGNVAKFGTVYAVNLKLIDIHETRVKNSVFQKVPGGEQALLDCFSNLVHKLMGTRHISGAAFKETVTPGNVAIGSTSDLADLGFTDEMFSRIQQAGLAMNSRAVAVVRRLLGRGFSPEEITGLIVDRNILSYNPREAETFAIYYLVGMNPRRFQGFIKKGLHLTAYYNKQQESTGLEVTKWVTFGTGLLMGLFGGMFYGLYAASSSDSGLYAGHVSMGIGVALLLVSITTMIIDGINIGYLPDGFLENAKKDEIVKKLGKAARRLSWGFAPGTGKMAGVMDNGNGSRFFGLSLSFSF